MLKGACGPVEMLLFKKLCHTTRMSDDTAGIHDAVDAYHHREVLPLIFGALHACRVPAGVVCAVQCPQGVDIHERPHH
jgi:hypothetical protein